MIVIERDFLITCFLAILGLPLASTHGQTLTLDVTVGGNADASVVNSLPWAITQANASDVQTIININLGSGQTISPGVQQFIALNPTNTSGLAINGNGAIIDMGGSDRAFFIAGGNVGLNGLTIQNGNATGGNGADFGGGGAGLGGGIFVANGNSLGLAATVGGAFDGLLLSPTNVSLTDVVFVNNSATGGDGSEITSAGLGGGGGMGGNGAVGWTGAAGPSESAGGGGGGFGVGANGGAGSSGGDDASDGAFLTSYDRAGDGGQGGGNGGRYGGGGGGGDGGDFIVREKGAGGGGGIDAPNPTGTDGGAGAFGGGGGGAGTLANLLGDYDQPGGNGGFGGGGGGGGIGGNGGFGGGGGGAAGSDGGDGGFAGGSGAPNLSGGGAGLGGAIFVMDGANLTINQGSSFSGSTVNPGGGPGAAGSAYGDDLFLGENVTFNVPTGQNLQVNNLGGAGNLSDSNVTNDPQAQGGITVTGGGTLTITGASNYYTGNTVLNNGTLALADGALEQGTALVVIGQNPGDNGTLQVGSGSTLNIGGFSNSTDIPLELAQQSGSTGTFTIGNGAGSSGAILGFRAINGGDGSAVVQFNQNYAVGGPGDTTYPMLVTLTGSLQVQQNGPGTTLLNPVAGPNTFTGGVFVNDGTLQLTSGALPTSSEVTVAGGALDFNGNSQALGDLVLQSGEVTSSSGPVTITPTSVTTSQGQINVAIIGGTTLLQDGTSGTTQLLAANSFTGPTLIEEGTLSTAVVGALGGTVSVTINTGGTLAITVGDSVNNDADLNLNGGVLTISSGITEALGDIDILQSSIFDLPGVSSTVLFADLTAGAPLQIWNWSMDNEAVLVTGTVTGDLSLITFYSDSGNTSLGTAILDGNELIPLPEPSPVLFVAFGLAVFVFRRNRTTDR